ncbi:MULTISPECIES: MerR family transcriptional regulator [unclassified Caulobacter]|uniref:MerR family transcriptional regulator n=1 Tax=unclassified Caulobacter TaxID=2648921 RepID=UPI0006F5E4B7|nr:MULTISPECIES: MerR family transcriptional regulator [unclassified Caulobacter]KQV62129.1 MerR family transcriptional regulator [Caulobacter sp. Root342]KQV64660.1 MerR family transcriptional regulator [Caulobacter sp. Root343]
MRASVDVLSPSEAARHLGISTKALRLYEDRGLLRPTRTATGWRAYGPDDVRRAAEIVALRSLGFSLKQVERVVSGDAAGLEPALGGLQARLELEFGQLSQRLERINALRRALARGEMPAVLDLADLAVAPAAAVAGFNLPWPWGGEWFEVRGVRALNYIVGPLGSGKTRLARMLAQHLPGGVFLGLDRLERREDAEHAVRADSELRERVEASLAWLVEDGATESGALLALVVGLEQGRSNSLVIDMIEQGLDELTQQAVISNLRRRGHERPPLFMLTRSSAILDPAEATPDEAVIFCPANHAPPFTVRIAPGAPGYDAMVSCLGPPEVRARTEGMIALMPRQGRAER